MILTPQKMLGRVFCLVTPWLLAAVSGLGGWGEARARVTRDYLGNTGTVSTIHSSGPWLRDGETQIRFYSSLSTLISYAQAIWALSFTLHFHFTHTKIEVSLKMAASYVH